MTEIRSRRAATALALLLLLGMTLPGVAGAGSRMPVSSSDDATSPTANRIAAVGNIVSVVNARLERVRAAYPPNPCAEITGACDAAYEALAAYQALAEAVADACAGNGAVGPGDAVITDADAYAADSSANGIAGQLGAIATVLGNATDRLRGINVPNPGPPEIEALTALETLVGAGGTSAADWSAGEFFPPNPCTPLG